MKTLLIVAAATASLSLAQARQTFTGTITDDMCGPNGHAQMRMGPTDGECTVACVLAHGARYALSDGSSLYVLSDQKTPEQFAGQKVSVVGTLDAKTMTITVESISATN
jgi:hypothetical protein